MQIKFIFCLLRLPNLFFIIIAPPCSSFTQSKQSSSSARVRAAAGDGSVSQSSKRKKKKKPNPLQQLLTLEWQLNVLKPFFSLRFLRYFLRVFSSLWFGFHFAACCRRAVFSFSVFCHIQAFTLSCSPFVLLFLMHVRHSQKGEQKKIQIQFEAHFFSNAHHKTKKLRTSWELFLVFLCHKSDFCILTCRMCVWVPVWVRVQVSVNEYKCDCECVTDVIFIKLKTNY